MTAMAGAGVYLDMMARAGLWESVRRHVEIKGDEPGLELSRAAGY